MFLGLTSFFSYIWQYVLGFSTWNPYTQDLTHLVSQDPTYPFTPIFGPRLSTGYLGSSDKLDFLSKKNKAYALKMVVIKKLKDRFKPDSWK